MIELPKVEFFAAQNPFTGSLGDFRFRLVPKGEEIHAYTYAVYCFEKASVMSENTFLVSREGLEQIKAWLLEEEKRYVRGEIAPKTAQPE